MAEYAAARRLCLRMDALALAVCCLLMWWFELIDLMWFLSDLSRMVCGTCIFCNGLIAGRLASKWLAGRLLRRAVVFAPQII